MNKLNISQQEAVNYLEGPVLILAGAGTGKTRVLTSRIANILSQGIASSQNILAVTFTNKAAREMQDRVKELISDVYVPNIGTFHSIATKILRQYISKLELGFSPNFTITDAADQLKLVKNIAAQKGINTKAFNPKLLLDIISRWKDLALLPHKISDSDIKSVEHEVARTVYIEYQQSLLTSNALDFSDLLLYNNELFINCSDLLAHYQEKYKYILIDEYQDTNALQYLWIRMLANKHKNICCVGDDDQSIYSWRGADITNILRFEKDFPNSKIIKLEQNYRSNPQILMAASSVIEKNKNRHVKSLWTDKNIGEKIKVVYCFNDKEEATFIASSIKKLCQKYNANNIAILVRTSSQTRILEEMLIYFAVPYRIIGSVNFYDRMEIRDILAYIRVTLNYSNNLALERIINVPRRSIGAVTIGSIKDYATAQKISMFEAIKAMIKEGLLKSKTKETLETLVNQLENWNEKYRNSSAFLVTKSMLNESGYLEMLKEEKTDESKTRINNVNELLNAINEFENIEAFIEHVSLVTENEQLDSEVGAVNLMTLHAAKGLEFDLVFLPGWEEGILPHQRSLQGAVDNSLEEERRLAYVGITRAKEDLYITFAASRLIFGELTYPQPSRFLADIPKEAYINTSSTQTYNTKYSPAKIPTKNNIEKAKASNNYNSFKVGSYVKHITFGKGVIIRISNDNLEIAFNGGKGVKTIKKEYLELV